MKWLQRTYEKLAWRMFLDNPLMGVGAGNFPINADL